MTNLLYVCKANRTRGFYAQISTEDRIKEQRITGINVSSAGLDGSSHLGMPEPMIEVLAEAGCMRQEFSAHMPVKVTKELLELQDIVLCMMNYHVERVLEISPSMNGKVYTLPAYAGYRENQIVDPEIKIAHRTKKQPPFLKFIGNSSERNHNIILAAYEETIAEIDTYIDIIIEKLVKENKVQLSAKVI